MGLWSLLFDMCLDLWSRRLQPTLLGGQMVHGGEMEKNKTRKKIFTNSKEQIKLVR